MSYPKNHHYVSQCHQKKFFNYGSGFIYIYDKELGNYYSKNSAKNLFSKEHLNTRYVNGKFDQVSLENELKILFEDNFEKHLSKIIKFLSNQDKLQETYESLCWLTTLGILGELRHPTYKANLDSALSIFESRFLSRFYNKDEEKIKKNLFKNQKTPFLNNFGYISIALQILEKLEPLDFIIYKIESNDHFFLPDNSCFQIRGRLKNYPNPYIIEILQLGIPLSDNIFILATPQLLKSNLHGIQFITENNSNITFEINRDLFLFARKGVACSDKNYLMNTIDKIKMISPLS